MNTGGAADAGHREAATTRSMRCAAKSITATRLSGARKGFDSPTEQVPCRSRITLNGAIDIFAQQTGSS
jgi:hypothetical protein